MKSAFLHKFAGCALFSLPNAAEPGKGGSERAKGCNCNSLPLYKRYVY